MFSQGEPLADILDGDGRSQGRRGVNLPTVSEETWAGSQPGTANLQGLRAAEYQV